MAFRGNECGISTYFWMRKDSMFAPFVRHKTKNPPDEVDLKEVLVSVIALSVSPLHHLREC